MPSRVSHCTPSQPYSPVHAFSQAFCTPVTPIRVLLDGPIRFCFCTFLVPPAWNPFLHMGFQESIRQLKCLFLFLCLPSVRETTVHHLQQSLFSDSFLNTPSLLTFNKFPHPVDLNAFKSIICFLLFISAFFALFHTLIKCHTWIPATTT